jgi:hypothetical protein
MDLTPVTRARLQAALAVLIAVLIWWYHRGPLSAVLAAVATILALLAWLSPSHHAPVQRLLDRSARRLVAGFSWLVLALVYFGVFTPLRWLRACVCRPLLTLRPDRRDTYLQPLPPRPRQHFERQF